MSHSGRTPFTRPIPNTVASLRECPSGKMAGDSFSCGRRTGGIMPAQNPSGSPYAQLRLRFGEFVLGYSLAKPERQPKKITRRGEARLNHSAEGRGVRGEGRMPSHRLFARRVWLIAAAGSCMVTQWREPCWRISGRQSRARISWPGKALPMTARAAASATSR